MQQSYVVIVQFINQLNHIGQHKQDVYAAFYKILPEIFNMLASPDKLGQEDFQQIYYKVSKSFESEPSLVQTFFTFLPHYIKFVTYNVLRLDLMLNRRSPKQ